MTDPKDSQLDTLLTKHFARKLDGQLGRASAGFERMARFQQQLQEAPPAAKARVHVNRWMLGLVGAAAAAAIAGVMVFAPVARIVKPVDRSSVAQLPTSGSGVVLAADASPLEHEVAWRTLDRGTVFIGDEEQPMRSYVRQRVDNFRWEDPQSNLKVEMSVPHDQVMLVNMKSY
jgi:hypothetical protein